MLKVPRLHSMFSSIPALCNELGMLDWRKICNLWFWSLPLWNDATYYESNSESVQVWY